MGEPWKIFANAQCLELIDNTYSVWISINGVNGRKFISRFNPNTYIFLPMGGYWVDGAKDYNGSNGFYWSNNINTSDNLDAYYMYLYSNGVNMNIINRRAGISIRPIAPKRPW